MVLVPPDISSVHSFAICSLYKTWDCFRSSEPVLRHWNIQHKCSLSYDHMAVCVYAYVSMCKKEGTGDGTGKQSMGLDSHRSVIVGVIFGQPNRVEG